MRQEISVVSEPNLVPFSCLTEGQLFSFPSYEDNVYMRIADIDTPNSSHVFNGVCISNPSIDSHGGHLIFTSSHTHVLLHSKVNISLS